MTTSPATTSVTALPLLTSIQRFVADFVAGLRAKNVLFFVRTFEELRAERTLQEAGSTAKFPTLFWDCSTGLSDGAGRNRFPSGDPSTVLATIRDSKERAVYVLRDFHRWFDPITVRTLRSLARQLQSAPAGEARAIVILCPPNVEIPPELTDCANVVDLPLPDRVEIARIVDTVVSALPEGVKENALGANGADREAVIDAALGLTAEGAASCYSRSLVTFRRIDPKAVAAEKKRVVAREKVLRWHDPDPRGLEAVGGLDNLKSWLKKRKSAFSAKARSFGLPAPKGVFLVGLPGCGKSLIAKCIANYYGVPCLQLDGGALKSKYVGESEANVRKALDLAVTVSPCVLWIDEIEKALAGATGEQGDGGVSADALGAILSWMQERQGSVFVIATANDVRALPPELLRKGRFDEMFWVDAPNKIERQDVLRAALAQHGRSTEAIDLVAIADATDSFTGAEIAAIVPEALFEAFEDGERALTTDDLVRAAANVVPLVETSKEKITALRDWAKGRARPASSPDVASANGPSVGRALEL